MRNLFWMTFATWMLHGQLVPGEEIAKEARQILKERCFSCHGESGANEGGFNYSLNRKRLVRELVVPSSADESKLFERVSKGEMPPDGDRLPQAEIDTLRKWIDEGAAGFAAEVERKFVTPLEMHTSMRNDLEKAADRDRPFMRYFTLTHLYNAGFEDNELESHRRGLSKLLNSLSWGREVRVPIPIDAEKTILRIDLRNYKWNETDAWIHVVSADPYRVEYSDEMARSCAEYTLCQQPHVRADWFVFAASRPPLYNTILGLPESPEQFVRFEKERLGVDVARNLRDYNNVLRAGFYPSGVSKSNRLIERHESSYGAYWKSYDFKPVDTKNGIVRRSNLKANPTGPDDSIGFEHDGGEMIFNLPNGLQAYMLTDALGTQIPKGPTDVVVDKEAVSRGRDPEVINGVSCMNCHWSGMLKKSDQIRDHVLKQQNSYPSRVVEFVKAVYAERKDLDAAFQQDRDRFEAAVKKCGLPSLSKTEPVAALAFQFDEPLDFELAAAEAGVEPTALKDLLSSSAELGRQLGSLPLGQSVPRETYVANFRMLIQELKLKHMMESLPEEYRDITTAVNLWHGIGVKVDQTAAAKMILERSKTQHPIAIGLAAQLYSFGQNVEKRSREGERLAKIAMEPLHQIADGNDTQSTIAQLVLGDLYDQGLGTEKNTDKALALYRKAADSDHPVGALNLAILLAKQQNFRESLTWARKAASQGLPDGNTFLGIIHAEGLGVTQNLQEAESFFKKAAEQNSPHAQARLGLMHYHGLGVAKDFAEAFRYAESSASQEDPSGQELLASLYFSGDGVAKDLSKAFANYRKAANQGHAMAQLQLGGMYAKGNGTIRNDAQALFWFQKAADQNLALAQETLGLCFRDGLGCAANQSNAFKWFEKAASQGIATAQNSLGDMYYSGNGIAQNYKEAFNWFELAAKQNLPIAQFNVGHMHSRGFGVTENDAEAISWFRKAAKSNVPEAQNSLGLAYKNGTGVTRDYQEAIRWFQLAADQGFAMAQDELGEMYYHGFGGTVDYSQAVKWYRKAAEQNYATGQANLAHMLNTGKGVSKNDPEAIQWFKKAADQNISWAIVRLADMHENGTGTPKDVSKAIQLYTQAANLGNADSQYRIAEINYHGRGIPVNYAEALKWHKLAANQNKFGSIASLISMYRMGQGTPQNFAEARMWIQKANQVIALDSPDPSLLESRKQLIAKTLELITELERR